MTDLKTTEAERKRVEEALASVPKEFVLRLLADFHMLQDEVNTAGVHLDHEIRHRFIPLTNRPRSREEITKWLERHQSRQQAAIQQGADDAGK